MAPRSRGGGRVSTPATISRLERALRAAQAASDRAMERRRALPTGSSRARVTTANALWMTAAEHRDRIAEQLEKARQETP